MYAQPNRRRASETPDQRRRRWARRVREFDTRQRQREQERADEEESLDRQLREGWERRWAAMTPEERAAYAEREAELDAQRVARMAEAAEDRRRRRAERDDPFSTRGT